MRLAGSAALSDAGGLAAKCPARSSINGRVLFAETGDVASATPLSASQFEAAFGGRANFRRATVEAIRD